MVANHQQLRKGKRITISSIGTLSEAVRISALFHIWFLFHTVAIASLGFLRSESFRASVFCNKKGIDNAQLARVGLDWEGFGWTLSYVSSTQSRRVATVYSDVSLLARAGVCSCALPGLFHACSTLSSPSPSCTRFSCSGVASGSLLLLSNLEVS